LLVRCSRRKHKLLLFEIQHMPLVVHTLNKAKMQHTQTDGSSIATTFSDNIFCCPSHHQAGAQAFWKCNCDWQTLCQFTQHEMPHRYDATYSSAGSLLKTQKMHKFVIILNPGFSSIQHCFTFTWITLLFFCYTFTPVTNSTAVLYQFFVTIKLLFFLR
jgi:hypothetical protein